MAENMAVQAYKDFVSLEKPVRIWTPDGGYNAPKLIAEAKTPTKMDMPETISFLRGQNPKQRQLTSGEWHQIREYLKAAKPDIEDNMITGAYERTSTLVDFDHGLVIQIPDIDTGNHLVRDGNGIIKGRHEWEMALPKKSGYIGQMPKDSAKFFNTAYGMDEAAKQLPDYAYFLIDDNPTGTRNLLRGLWSSGRRECRRVSVDGDRGPLSSGEDVASRGAVDNTKLVNRLNDARYAAHFEELVQSVKQAQPEQAANIISQINEQLKGALVWEDI